MSRRLLLLGALFALSLDSCNEAGSSAARTRVFDSAGVTIVENRDAQPPDIAAWQVDSVPLLRIGREDGPESYRFDGVYDIIRLSDSTIVVVDGSPSIRFFDTRGQFLHSVGRRGDGPGEYHVISMMRRIKGDSLLVWDFPARRVTVLGPDGQFERSERGPVTEGFFFGFDVFSDGTLLGMYDPPPDGARPASGILETTSAMVRFSPSSGIMDTLAQITTKSSYVSGGEHFSITSMPYHAEALGAATGRAAYLGNSARYEIGYYSRDGRLIRVTRLDRLPIRFESSTRDRYIARQLARARTDAARERVTSVYAEMPFPDAFPAFDALAVDADSNLWVRTYSASDSVPSQWTVFDPEGRLLAEATTPARFTVFEIGRGDLLGVQEDSLGVQQVRVQKR